MFDFFFAMGINDSVFEKVYEMYLNEGFQMLIKEMNIYSASKQLGFLKTVTLNNLDNTRLKLCYNLGKVFSYTLENNAAGKPPGNATFQSICHGNDVKYSKNSNGNDANQFLQQLQF
jgi:hypothetical protein